LRDWNEVYEGGDVASAPEALNALTSWLLIGRETSLISDTRFLLDLSDRPTIAAQREKVLCEVRSSNNSCDLN